MYNCTGLGILVSLPGCSPYCLHIVQADRHLHLSSTRIKMKKKSYSVTSFVEKETKNMPCVQEDTLPRLISQKSECTAFLLNYLLVIKVVNYRNKRECTAEVIAEAVGFNPVVSCYLHGTILIFQNSVQNKQKT